MTDHEQPSDDLDQYLEWLVSVDAVDIDPKDYIGQWTREQWQSAFEVRKAITTPIDVVRGIGKYLHPSSSVPEWLRDILNTTWFMRPGSDPAPSWLTSVDHRIDWFSLADEHPELILYNPYTQLITPSMMGDAVTLARARAAEVITYADLGPGRDPGTIVCGFNALYIAADHDPTLIVDITDIFGGITPAPTSGPKSIPALSTAIDPDTVFFGWEWSNMYWPDTAHQ
ncbi:hypothetical protein ABDK96_15665 [Citricoccus nitrophenolicus]|uniref:Uncharacterized protein n=1 Tax=Citricoccus nitrophenolicus TaxID=863575 RepID=A0ABV0ILR8_9MICC